MVGGGYPAIHKQYLYIYSDKEHDDSGADKGKDFKK